jgi:hypothetical protein
MPLCQVGGGRGVRAARMHPVGDGSGAQVPESELSPGFCEEARAMTAQISDSVLYRDRPFSLSENCSHQW